MKNLLATAILVGSLSDNNNANAIKLKTNEGLDSTLQAAAQEQAQLD